MVSSSIGESFQQGSAVLVATIQGFILGNSSMDLIEELKSFKESITLLLLSVVFISLAAELKSSHVSLNVFYQGMGLFIGLFLIRLLTVFITTSKSGCSWQEKFLVTWCAPRGIVAASMAGLFAHKLEKEGFIGGETFEALIFFIIISTVLVYGTSFKWMAQKLGLTNKEAHGILIVGATPWTIDLAEHLKQLEVPVAICDSMWHGLKQARLNGIQTYYGDTLNMLENDTLELSQYHTVLAATSNTSYNTLVCTKLSAEFGWESVYQLPPDTSDDGNPIKELPVGMRGRIIADPRATFFNLYDLSYKGWKFRKTSITENYSLSKLMEETPSAFHLLHVSKNKKLFFIENLSNHPILPGEQVLSMVPPNTKIGQSKSES